MQNRRIKRNLQQFNHIKYSPTRALYSLKQSQTALDIAINAYRTVKQGELNDKIAG